MSERIGPGEVTAADGTRIAYQRIGSGPPVVVLPGAMNPGDAWRAVALEMADEHTFFLVDRRGYPPSGPGPSPGAFATETVHVRAVIDAAGGPVHLLGHSYGGVLALHTAESDPELVRSLLLYEAPVLAGGPRVAPALARYREQLAAGDPMGAIGTFLTEVVRIPPQELAAIADGGGPPEPADIGALAEALLPDLESVAGLAPDARRWSALRPPTLLMAGALSWGDVRESTEALRAALPHAQTVVWEDQSHFANTMAPALVAATLREFLGRLTPPPVSAPIRTTG